MWKLFWPYFLVGKIYPAWQITVDGIVYTVSQDGTVSYKKPVKLVEVEELTYMAY